MFDIKNKSVIISPLCLLMPELKAVSDHYKEDRLAVFSYICFMTEGDEEKNPYSKLPEDRKKEVLLRDFKGSYSPDDYLIRDALEKIKSFETPEERLYSAAKQAVDNVAEFLKDKSTDLQDPKEAKLVVDILTKMNDVAKNLSDVREIKQKAINKGRVSGNRKLAYDQN